VKAVCEICPHRCRIEEGGTGFCRARFNRNGKIVCGNYGMVTSIALDPIEKKPLRRFFPGSRILSVGSYGCNMRCSFCQNSEISMADQESSEAIRISPQELVQKALEFLPRGNIGIAYTYNEPLVGYEFVYDCAKLASDRGLKNVVVTNGCICHEPLVGILPYIDAMNIDLKAFTASFYRKMAGDFDTVKHTIETAGRSCHVEVTTLIIPGENDSDDEMRELSGWLASVNDEIPLHITRFFPAWHMNDRGPTPVDTVRRLAGIAGLKLKHVYLGNC